MFHLKLISMSMTQEYKNFNNQGGVKAPHNNKEATMQKVNKIKYDEIRGQEKNIIQISSSKNHSYNFLETEIKYFTQENGTKVYQFFLDGEIVKETTINPNSRKLISIKTNNDNFYNKKELVQKLMGKNPEPRFDFIIENILANRIKKYFL